MFHVKHHARRPRDLPVGGYDTLRTPRGRRTDHVDGDSLNMERATVVFRGRVQGVGFRWSTRSAVSSFSTTGYVMNCKDGSVRLVLEGSRHDVSSAIQAILRRMESHVTGHDVRWAPSTGEFSDFRIAPTGPA
ncbi:MAG: acylphosphatase [Planctomycetota bacterium]